MPSLKYWERAVRAIARLCRPGMGRMSGSSKFSKEPGID